MPVRFHGLKVSAIKKETDDAVTISFEVPPELEGTFSYLPGQYLTLKLDAGGAELRRAYSISSSDYCGEPLSVTVRRSPGGTVSQIINDDIKPGDAIEVLPPLGRFTANPDPDRERLYIMFGAGSGITPLISIIKSVLKVEVMSRIVLFYQNRYEEGIIFKELIGELEQIHPNFRVYHFLSRPSAGWTGMSGRIDIGTAMGLVGDLDEELLATASYYLCGPQTMMDELQAGLKTKGVDASLVHRESFTVPLEETGRTIEQKPALLERDVVIKLYGETSTIRVRPDETIVRAALREGLEPPFSCQIGACSTCRAKTLSGELSMDEREALTDDEIGEGFVLTCQAHPLTDDVIINYDY